MPIRTRFAPSPTGSLHIGGVRTALFAWLYARHHRGAFILRVEDTDRGRTTDESVQTIIDGMVWLGLNFDEGPIFQSDRFDRYSEVTDQLLKNGKAYRCYCTREELRQVREEQRRQGIKPRYNRRCRDTIHPERRGAETTIRFRNPLEGTVVFEDQVRGRVTISNEELDDLVIVRADGTPTYNFAVVVDDRDMGITHVIRGDDHVNNTPRQINIFEALETLPPIYAHVPSILGPDGQRLSKRHGAVSVLQYRADGFLPEALRNYLVRLGWSHGDQEIFSLDEMIEQFDIRDVNRAASAFDLDKLRWLNQYYIKGADAARLALLLGQRLYESDVETRAGPELVDVVEALRERAQTLEEMAEKSDYFYRDFETYEATAARKHLRPVVAEMFGDLRTRLAVLTEWTVGTVHDALVATAEAHGVNLGKIAQPLRVAISGTAATPPIDETVVLVGREKTLERIDRALCFIEEQDSGDA